MTPRTKKTLSIGIRALLAVAGISFIIWAIVWTDHAVLDAGTTLPTGQTLAEKHTYKVASGNVAMKGDPEATLTLLVPVVGAKPVPVEVRGDQLADYKLGIVNTLREANYALLVLGLLLVAPIYPIQAFRWWLLLQARGLRTSLWQCFRLVMVGSFFNYCMPGTTGGDVLKAYYAARHSHRRTDSVLSVLIDRVAGLAGLVILGGTAGVVLIVTVKLGAMDMADAQYRMITRVTGFVWLLMLGGIAGAGIYFSRRMRTLLHVDAIIDRLPGKAIFKKIDEAAVAYRDHLGAAVGAILISVPVHFCLALSSALAGNALGIEHSYLLMMTVIPVLFLAGALPLTPQGVGVMEGIGLPLLVVTDMATANQVIGMLLLIRIFQITYSMGGSIFLLKGDIHMRPAEAMEKMEAAGGEATASSRDVADAPADSHNDVTQPQPV